MIENSPEHLRRAAENSLAAFREYRAAAPGLFVELAEAGHPVETVNELWDSGTPEVLGILLEWLPNVTNPALKMDILAMLAAKWARPRGPRAAAAELDRLTPADSAELVEVVRETVGSVLSRVTDKSLYPRILEAARDRSWANDRGLYVLALGRYPAMREESAPVLFEVLAEDEDYLASQAARALIKLGYGEQVLPRVFEMQADGYLTKGEANKLLRKVSAQKERGR